MLEGIRSVLSFLSVIPSGNGDIRTVSKNMHLFPVAGVVIGLVAGAAGFGLSEAGVDPLIVGLLVAAAIAVITGMHHTDGLADWADGLMAGGSREKKLAAMKDVATGSAGVAAIIIYYTGMTVALSQTAGVELLTVIILAEVAAKFSMVLMAGAGRSATCGSGSHFVNSMRDRKKLALAFMVTLGIFVIAGAGTLLVMLAVGIMVPLFLAALASRSFGGVTGDVMGAANELVRLCCVVVFVSV